MGKSLIIGSASNYSWNDLQYWVNSIKKTGFQGDIVITATNIKRETIQRLADHGVIVYLYGKKTPTGDVVSTTSMPPHVDRFFQIWNFLEMNPGEYEFVVTTDTRDVVFQRNPVEWFVKQRLPKLVCVPENMLYKDEPWNNKNLLDAFGSFFHNRLKEKMIYNVGIIAGDTEYVKGLLFHIFHLSINRPIPIVDQAVYNMLIDSDPWKTLFLKDENHGKEFAINLGTTIEAVEAGSGDLGQVYKNNIELYKDLYKGVQPITCEDMVKTVLGVPYFIVHQYDRIPSLKEKIHALYGDENVQSR